MLCFTGDGGIWYHISELETAVKENLHVVILVNNNHSLNQEKTPSKATKVNQQRVTSSGFSRMQTLQQSPDQWALKG